MGHALVQRVLLESLGVMPLDPRAPARAPILSPPAKLDMTPGFADDGLIAGSSTEVLRALEHILPIMPQLGLRFSRLEAIPAAGNQTTADLAAFRQHGCTINHEQCASIMKSPVGNVAFCEKEVGKQVDKAVKAIQAIARLPDAHSAL